MIVKAEGAGYNGIYRARKTPLGWCFLGKDGTLLTPGIGRIDERTLTVIGPGHPIHYPTPEELLSAVRTHSGAVIKILPDRPFDPYGN